MAAVRSALALVATGCLAGGDDELAVDLDGLAFTIDIASWGIDEARAQALLETSCDVSPTVCEAAAPGVCTRSCSAACNGRHRCDLLLGVDLHRRVDAALGGVAEASVDEVSYEVRSNTLDVATSPLVVSVATIALTDAVALATIDDVAAAATVEATPLTLDPAGRDHLAHALAAPFQLLVGSRLTVAAGQPIPSGRLDAELRIRGRARR